MRQGHRRSNGFTFFDMMIGMGILSLLVALAVPAWSGYSKRAKISDCLAIAAVPKLIITEFHELEGRWPSSARSTEVPDSLLGLSTGHLTEYCAYFAVRDDRGAFGIGIDPRAIGIEDADAMLGPIFVPTGTGNGQVSWKCTAGITDAASINYLPPSCRSRYQPQPS